MLNLLTPLTSFRVPYLNLNICALIITNLLLKFSFYPFLLCVNRLIFIIYSTFSARKYSVLHVLAVIVYNFLISLMIMMNLSKGTYIESDSNLVTV